MGLGSDLKIIYHMLFTRGRGSSHAQRLDNFYSGQAAGYDDFRKRLLKGRQEMMEAVPTPEGGVWVDMGGGTGANLEWIADRIPRIGRVYVVDLATSLLKVAQERVVSHGWDNVCTVEADATTFTPDEGYADVVTFSYSLTMIPNWFSAIDNALRILKPGGILGVADFYVARKWPGENNRKHSWFTRSYWPVHFSTDNVFLSSDHLPYLQEKFESLTQIEKYAKIPFIPFIRAPYYIYTGRKPVENEPLSVIPQESASQGDVLQGDVLNDACDVTASAYHT